MSVHSFSVWKIIKYVNSVEIGQVSVKFDSKINFHVEYQFDTLLRKHHIDKDVVEFLKFSTRVSDVSFSRLKCVPKL